MGETRFLVDRSKTMELAKALFDDDPVYSDPEAARAAGFEAIPAPLTASVLASHWATRTTAETARELGMDLTRILHGEAAWEYVRPLVVGDELCGRTRVVDVKTREGSRGGTMTLVTMETEFVDAAGEVALRKRDTLIERGA